MILRFLMQLARAGLFVDKVFTNTRFEHMVNAYGDHGCAAATAVRTKCGPTINWWHASHGRIRVDGRDHEVSRVMKDMRQAFKAFSHAELAHAKFTQRKGKILKPLPLNPHDAAKRERKVIRRGQTLMVESAVVYDKEGKDDIWDHMEMKYGVCNLPDNCATPWIIQLRTGITVEAYPDGRLRVNSIMAYVEAIDEVEALLQSHFSAVWTDMEKPQTTGAKIAYGKMGPRAADRAQLEEGKPFH